MKTHRVLNRSCKCANVRYRKKQVFLFVDLPFFTTAFLLEINIWTWLSVLRVLFLKVKNLKKDAYYRTIPGHNKRQKKNIEKRERKTKNDKKKSHNNEDFFYFYFFLLKNILLENIFEKLSLYFHICISYFAWQVIWNAVIKYQPPYIYTMVL